mgnify:CR=1 FL=1
MRRDWRYSDMSQDDIAAWWSESESCGELDVGDVVNPSFSGQDTAAGFLFLASGCLDISGSERQAPALLRVAEHSVHRVVAPAYVVRLPDPTKNGPD